jgi:stage III sporulation protein AB
MSKKYIIRVNELEEMKNALNMFKSKIKFTYEPIPEIFEEIVQNTSQNVGQVFRMAKDKMKTNTASKAWEEAVEESENNLTKEDKYVLKTLSKLLGQTDVDGQTSQIEITQKFLETQLEEAQKEKEKNEKLYSKLGTTIGLAIVIILC